MKEINKKEENINEENINEEIIEPIIEKDELTKVKEAVIGKLNDKDFGIYFFTLDTKGNVCGSLANNYEHVKILNELGYKAFILTEKSDYKLITDDKGVGIDTMLGEEYAKLPHVAINDKNIKIGPQDFVIIPEQLSTLMEQLSKLPCKKVVFCNSYDYIFEILPVGTYWANYNITDCITTSQKQADYIKSIFQTVEQHIVPVSIPDYFKPYNKIQKPVVSLVSRNQIDVVKLIKQFYIQYPQYRWIAFRELRGMNRKDFARNLKESCLAVWIDDISGFGTFPIECIECGVPIIAKVPNLIPEWMEAQKNEDGTVNLKDFGMWINNPMELPAVIADFIKGFIEDMIPDTLYENIKNQKGQYTEEKQKIAIQSVYSELINKRIVEITNLKK